MSILQDITAIILAGGRGTRIKGVDANIPKPLLKVGRYNLIEHNLLRMKKFGISKFLFSLGYHSDKIKAYFDNGSRYEVKVDYLKDPKPLGDAGAFKYCYSQIRGTSLVVNADDIRTELNFEEMLELHMSRNALSTVAVSEQKDTENHGIFETDSNNLIKKFIMNPSKEETDSRYANTGLYIMEKEVLNYLPNGYLLFKDILGHLCESQRLYAFLFNGLYFNVGTPDILNKARQHIRQLNQI